MRILVVEDDATLRNTLAEQLRGGGFAVDVAADGPEGEYAGTEYALDVAIVDLGLPGKSGMEVIRAWRKAGRQFPVLILTARDRWQDKVEGLQAGADDYLTKPFQFEELKARVQALLRRSAGWSSPVLRSGAIELDTGSQEVRVGGAVVEVTPFEVPLPADRICPSGQVAA